MPPRPKPDYPEAQEIRVSQLSECFPKPRLGSILGSGWNRK